jgi:hypothetical protein
MRFFADLSDPKSDPTDLCAKRISNADFFLRIFYGRPSPTGKDLNNFSFFRRLAANNQPLVEMVAPEYHEEDGHSTGSSSTQLPSQHPLRHRFQERHGGGIDYSTVPPTPLSQGNHLLSPVRTQSSSRRYNLRSTPERVAALDTVSVVGAGGGVAVSGVIVGGVPVSTLDVAGSGVAVGNMQRVRGGRVPRTGRGAAGRGSRRSRQSTGGTAGSLARGGVRNYTPAEIDSLLLTIKAICPIGNDHWETVAQLHSNRYAVCGRTAESLKRKFSSLASTQPSSGNPSMPRPVLVAKEIREAINRRAGITDADLSDFFDDGEVFDEELDDGDEVLNNHPPHEITVATNGSCHRDAARAQ